MSTVCGLDLSLTSTGIAVLRDCEPTLITHVGHGGHNGANHAHRSRRITSQCTAVIETLIAATANPMSRIDLAVIEDQLEHGPMLPSALDRSALWWGVYSALTARKIPVAVINPITLKVWFTGKGTATKLEMLNRARGLYRPAISTHDEADAIACATVGAFHLGDPVPFEVKERHHTALEKVEWPDLVAIIRGQR